MRRRDEDFLTMANVALKVLDDNKARWEGSGPNPMAESVQIIKDAAQDVAEARRGVGNAVSTGASTDKELAGDHAIDLAVELMGYAQVYARKQKNNTLLDQVSISRTKLEQMADGALPGALEDIYERIAALGGAVVPYGATDALLAEFKTAIGDYDKLKDLPRTIIVTRKGKNTSVPALLKGMRDEFKDVDKMMARFEKTDPQFVTDYRNARIVISRGGGHGDTPVDPPAHG